MTEDEAAADLLGATPASAEEPESTPEPEIAAAGSDDEAATDESKGDSILSGTKLDKILAKYGNDPDKLAEAIYEQWNSSSRLAREIEDLKTKVSSRPEEPEAPVQVDDTIIKRLDQRIGAIGEQVKGYVSRQEGLISEAEDIKYKIAELNGQISVADEYDKEKLGSKREALVAKLDGKKEKYLELAERIKEANLSLEDLQYQKTHADGTLKAAVAQAETIRKQEREYQTEVRREFDTAVIVAATALNLPPKSDEREYFAETMEAKIRTYLAKLPDDADAIDITEFVKREAERFAKINKLGKVEELKNLTREKISGRAAAVVAPSRTPAPTAPKPPGNLTAAQWRQRAAKLLG